MIKNLLKVFKSKVWIIWFILGLFIIVIPTYYFTNKDLIIWNLWYNFYVIEIVLSVNISLLFALFMWASLYKMFFFAQIDWKSITKNVWWVLWWFLWILVSWCPACSITLASYIWLASLISLLPYYWLELKLISVIMLVYVNYSIIKNLEICKIKKWKIKNW